MKNNDFAMLIVAILFIALASSGMNMITGSSSVTAAPGDVINIPFSFQYDDGDWFGSPTSVRLVLDEVGFGDGDEVVYSGTAVNDQVVSGSFNYEVPNTEGVYVIDLIYEMWYAGGSRWVTGAGSYSVTITVTLPEYEEPDIPADDPPVVEDPPAEDEDLGSGVVPDDTPTDQTVEAVILGDSLTDKITMLWELFKAFIAELIGGTK